MPEVPNIVRERLRASGPGGAHPDANVLAAFAEQVLPPAERAGVLDHLALCQECREVLAASVPTLETVPQVVAETEPAVSEKAFPVEKSVGWAVWFRWNRMAWAGLAAGVVVALGVLLLHPGKQGPDQALQKSRVTPAPPAVATDKGAPAQAPEIASTAENRPTVPAPTIRRGREKALTKSLAPVPAPPREHAAISGTLTASVAKKDEKVARDFFGGTGQPSTVSDTAEVAEALPAPVPTAGAMAGNEAAPVIRAKPARPSESLAVPAKTVAAEAKQEGVTAASEERAVAPGARAAMLQRPQAYAVTAGLTSQAPAQWAIRSDAVQRSLDSGVHWETVFQPHRPLLCVAAANLDVWVGGKGGDLFHSADSGVTWNPVHPSVPDKTLTDDITRIAVQGPAQVVLFTDKNESWATTDGGKTWDKK